MPPLPRSSLRPLPRSSLRPLPRSSLRPLRGSTIHSSAASPVHSYGGHAYLLFYAVYYMALIILTDYRLGFNRRPEIGYITTYGSYYEDSPRSSLRPLRGSAIHSSAASPVHSYGGHGDPLSLIDS